ncbi:MAG: histidine--tRNA ligase [Oligoflexus sp.]
MTITKQVQPKKLKGFRDFLPHQVSQRKKMIDVIWRHAVQAGFQAIETPVLEYAETLLGAGGQETDKEVYRFEDHGGRAVGLRFDLTVPFARFVAEHQGTLVFPFKKLQIGNSWRGEKPQKGRYREFCQADVDIIGVDSQAADIEVLLNILGNLNRLVPASFTMSIGHRKVLSAILQHAFPGLSATGEACALIALDKTAKIGVEKVRQLLLEIDGATPEGADLLQKILSSKDAAGDSDLSILTRIFAENEDISIEIERIRQTLSVLRGLVSGTKARVRLDLNIARGLGYYTGIVFETVIDQLPGFGSISSGGRYNDLVTRFSKQSLPGIGGSIGVDRLLAALEELGETENETRQGIFVAVATADALPYAFHIVDELRNGTDEMVDIGLNLGKLGNQFKYADRRKFAKVIVVGEEERLAGTYTMKDLTTGDEVRDLRRDQLLLNMKRR